MALLGFEQHDCELVALAISFDTTLVTMDRKLLKALPRHTVALG